MKGLSGHGGETEYLSEHDMKTLDGFTSEQARTTKNKSATMQTSMQGKSGNRENSKDVCVYDSESESSDQDSDILKGGTFREL